MEGNARDPDTMITNLKNKYHKYGKQKMERDYTEIPRVRKIKRVYLSTQRSKYQDYWYNSL